MSDYTLKIIQNKALLTSVEEPWKKPLKFTDLNVMVAHCKAHGIKITNPEVLPKNFQDQLK